MVSKPSSSSGCLVPFSAKLFPSFTIVPGDPRLPPAREGRAGVTASSPAPPWPPGRRDREDAAVAGPGLGKEGKEGVPGPPPRGTRVPGSGAHRGRGGGAPRPGAGDPRGAPRFPTHPPTG